MSEWFEWMGKRYPVRSRGIRKISVNDWVYELAKAKGVDQDPSLLRADLELPDDAIRNIRTSDKSTSELGIIYQRSPSYIRTIQRYQSYQGVDD